MSRVSKPKKIQLDDTAENREILATARLMRTPVAVMRDAMIHFENLGREFLAKAGCAEAAKIEAVADAGHEYILAAVKIAAAVAPYIHSRVSSIESPRGAMAEDEVPFVIRTPTVAQDSSAWLAAIGPEIIEREGQGAPLPANVVKLSRSQEWLKSVAADKRRVG